MRLFVLVLLLAVPAFGQTAKMDSLRHRLQTSTAGGTYDRASVDLMIELASLMRTSDITAAMEHINRALATADKLNYRKGSVQALQGKGVLYAITGEWDKSITITNKSAALAREYGLAKFEARAYNNLGIIYQRRGRYEEALHVLKKSIKIKEPLGDGRELAPTYNNIGVLYKRFGNYEEALKYYLKSNEALEGSNDYASLADVSNNIGNIAARLKDWPTAIKYNEAALDLHRKANNATGILRVQTNLGIYYSNTGDSARGRMYYLAAVKTAHDMGATPARIFARLNHARYYESKGEFDSARTQYECALGLSHQTMDMDNILTSAVGLSNACQITGNANRAVTLADSAYAVARKIGNQMILPEIHLVRTRAYRAAGRYEDAFAAMDAHNAVRDSLNKKERSRQISALEVEYGLQLKESENIRLQQEKALQELALREQQGRVEYLEKDKRLKQLRIEQQQAEIESQDETDKRTKAALASAHRQRAIQELKLESETLKSRIYFGGAIGLGIFLIVLIFLYRKKRQTEEREVKRSNELQQATGQILHHQQALEKKSEELEAALQALRERNELLEKLDKEKSEILAIAAHDLKNPVSTIHGLSRLIQDAEPGSPEIMECAQHITNSTNRILSLVSNLLDIELIETGRRRVSIAAVDITSVISEVVRAHDTAARRKNISVESSMTGLDANAAGDYETLVQILDNLVSNAVKFSTNGDNIAIRAYRDRSDICIEVADTGPGMTEADKQQLFKKFARLTPQPTNGEDSNGLGLYIVRKLVESLSGSIKCESEQGKGTTFVVRIPIAKMKQKQVAW